MLRRLKGALRRPLTLRDLARESEAQLQRPPFPADYYELLVSVRAKQDGSSLIEHWRQQFQDTLARVSGELTWELQRAQLLREIIETFDWSALHAAAKDVRHPDAWVGRFKDAFPKAASSTPETCRWLLTQAWILAICAGACLHELGERLYGVDAMKRAELDLVEAALREIQVTQVHVLDDVFEDCLIDPSLREALVR